MQAFGHASARLLDGAVAQQGRSATAAEACAGIHRLDLFGVGPMVLSRAADRRAAARLRASIPALRSLLRGSRSKADGEDGVVEEKDGAGCSQAIALYRQ